jgi:hypothetical protein
MRGGTVTSTVLEQPNRIENDNSITIAEYGLIGHPPSSQYGRISKVYLSRYAGLKVEEKVSGTVLKR